MSKSTSLVKCIALFVLMVFAPLIVAEGAEISIYVGWEIHRQELLRSAGEYNKLHPDVKVNIFGSGDVKSTVPVLLAANAIDAAVVSVEGYSSMVLQGFFQSVEPLLDRDPNWSKEDFVPFMTDLYSFNGQWYGIPFNWGPAYFHYNVDLFQNAGLSSPDKLDAQGKWTWDAFAQSVRRISQDTNGDGTFENYGYRVPAHSAEALINAWVAGNGGGFVDSFMNPTRITINTPATRTTLEFLRELIVNQGAPPITNTKFNGSGAIENAAFAKGTLGIYDQWMSGSTANVTAKGNGSMTHGWGVVAPPVSPAGKRASDMGSAYVGISANSQNATLVYDFMKYHLNNVGSLLANEYVTSLPPVRKVLQHPEIQKRLPVSQAQRGVILNAPNYPAFRMTWVQQGEFWKTAKPQLNRFWKGEAALDEVADEIMRLGQALIDSSSVKK